MRIGLRSVSFMSAPHGSSPSVPAASYQLVSQDTFESGSGNGSIYVTGPVTNWAYSSDYGFTPRVWTPQNSGKVFRFAMASEQFASNNSVFRPHVVMYPAYFTNSGLDVEGRIDFETKIPASGGFTRQDGGGSGSAFAAMCTIGNATRWHAFGVKSTSDIGIWVNTSSGDAALPAGASTVSGTMTDTTAGAWHLVSVRYKIGASGYLELWWDGQKVAEYSGDTVFNAGANTGVVGLTYVTGMAGGTASQNDLDYFSGLDNVTTYARV